MAHKKKPNSLVSWRYFRNRYEDEVLSSKAAKTQDSWIRTCDEFTKVCKPKTVEVDADMLAKYVNYCRHKLDNAESTIKWKLAVLKAALRWAWEMDLRETPVRVPKIKLPAGPSALPSRAVTEPEFDRILAAVPMVRRKQGDAPLWTRLLMAASWCDLRIGELLRLSWEPESRVRLLESAEGRPLIHFNHHTSQKGWAVCGHPISRPFWEVASTKPGGLAWPEPEGFVFPMYGFDFPHNQVHGDQVGKVIAQIGREAGVVTQDFSGKHATSHDIGRRAYIARLLKNPAISPYELRKLVRHTNLQTTMRHYDFSNAVELGRHIGWEE